MIKNQIKTVLLLGLLSGLMLVVGGLIGGQQGLTIGLIVAIAINFLSYWFSAKIVLAIYRAKEADKKKYAFLYQLIQELAQEAKLPEPKIYVIPSPQANAFATGRNPEHGVIAVTSGILELLTQEELKGVLAHEMSHIKNRDILIGTIAATIAAVISYVSMMVRWGAIFGGFGSRDDNRGGNILELLLLAILAPLMAMIIQLAVSRSREYLADESGAKMAKNPLPLASALEKLQKNIVQHPLRQMGTTDATAHLFISSPFSGKSLFNLFSTHPPVEERVKKLKAMKI